MCSKLRLLSFKHFGSSEPLYAYNNYKILGMYFGKYLCINIIVVCFQCISKSYQGGIIARFGSRVQSDDTWNCFTENLAEGEEGLKGEDFSDSNYNAR